MPFWNNQQVPLRDWKPIFKCKNRIPFFDNAVLDVTKAKPAI
jgi:hypothetical protein